MGSPGVHLLALSAGLAALVASVAAGWAHHLYRGALRETAVSTTTPSGFVLRIDPARVPPRVRGAFWAALVVGALGVFAPVRWAEATITPAAALGWLASVGALALGLWGYDRGLLWPSQSRRLGVSGDRVWWDEVDPQSRPGPAPTSVAETTARPGSTLELDRGFAVVEGSDGRGVVFGPLSDADLELLRKVWPSC